MTGILLDQQKQERNTVSPLSIARMYTRAVLTQSVDEFNRFTDQYQKVISQRARIGFENEESTIKTLKEGGAIVVISPHNTALEIVYYHGLLRQLTGGKTPVTFDSRLPLFMPPKQTAVPVEIRFRDMLDAVKAGAPQSVFSGLAHMGLHHVVGGGMFIESEEKSKMNSDAINQSVTHLVNRDNILIYPSGMRMVTGTWRRGVGRLILGLAEKTEKDIPLVFLHNGLRGVQTMQALLRLPGDVGGAYFGSQVLSKNSLNKITLPYETNPDKASAVLKWVESSFSNSFDNFISWARSEEFDQEQVEWLVDMHHNVVHKDLNLDEQ